MVDMERKNSAGENTRYCRQLGHHVPFRYCLEGDGTASNGPGFCRNIISCWGETLDIRGLLRKKYSEEEITQRIAPPQPKMASLYSLIREAKTRSG
jgi:hypothetical protein